MSMHGKLQDVDPVNAPEPEHCDLQASEAYLQTNNQVLSLTDQMNLGVRIVELDTHFFDVRSC